MVESVDVDVFDGADSLVETPRAHLVLKMRQGRDGMVVLHQGQALVHCYLTRNGMLTAGFVAEALGLKVPSLGEEAQARVSTGVLFRALAIARLDLSNDSSFPLLERLLEDAAMQRGLNRTGA